ncbi:hypothetical protein G5V59_24390 [Nocardioides sp. W3-2-3]|uniref:hypothetical protein n=1 Tax=Nocardioides convexus TaxID=2712224 RepID=UPI0024188C63|nr:hypothetical protein [Nocardioides convexus]NHA01778.1 hypothetical protein [Nocardioides convexus]
MLQDAGVSADQSSASYKSGYILGIPIPGGAAATIDRSLPLLVRWLARLHPSPANAANRAPRMGGFAKFGSTDAATTRMLRFSKRNPEAGYYDVIGHGSPDGLSGMSAEELAAKIASSSGGQNIRLLSCQTGCPSGTFAQDLSNRLRVRVMAPTTDIGASGSGKTLDMYGGQWRWFDPN